MIFRTDEINSFREKLVQYAAGFEVSCVLASNSHAIENYNTGKFSYHSFDLLAGLGAKEIFIDDSGDYLASAEDFILQKNDWLFGYFSYDVKNQLEKLSSSNPSRFNTPEVFFFQPEIKIFIRDGNEIEIESDSYNPEDIFNQILNTSLPKEKENSHSLQSRISKENYLQNTETLRQHIVEGDIYEVNFCQEFFAENISLQPASLFNRLMKISPNPMSAFMRMRDNYILSSSMERFLKKAGNKIISQPIKGTIRKSENHVEDTALQKQLQNDPKERAENVMIVDLVRNDLAKSCKPGSVVVEELFGVYSFAQVHQMISTVSGELRENTSTLSPILNAFPMGSMTGAPKLRAMQLIEEYETTRRGIYSGAIGYFSPEKDFDFNVVIRTFLYDATQQYLSLHVGSAITYDSIPEKEYEECMVKISGMEKALKN